MKVSLHMGAKGAAFSPAHNDGSMYTEDRGELRNTRLGNLHTDIYHVGVLTGAEKIGATGAAVKRFYEERLRDEYEKTLESASWKRNPDRVVSFQKWCAQKDRSVREVIVSVGDKDEYPDKGCLMKVVDTTMKVFCKSGLTVIATDMHLDEATPHVHIILGADLYGKKLDFGKTLADHGIERPEPDKKKSTENNEMKTLTEQVRRAAEDAADEWLKEHGMPPVDRVRRQRRRHETNKEFKQRSKREEADKKRIEQLTEELETVRAEKEQVETERDRAEQVLDENLAVIRQYDHARDELEKLKREAKTQEREIKTKSKKLDALAKKTVEQENRCEQIMQKASSESAKLATTVRNLKQAKDRLEKYKDEAESKSEQADELAKTICERADLLDQLEELSKFAEKKAEFPTMVEETCLRLSKWLADKAYEKEKAGEYTYAKRYADVSKQFAEQVELGNVRVFAKGVFAEQTDFGDDFRERIANLKERAKTIIALATMNEGPQPVMREPANSSRDYSRSIPF